MRLPTGSRVATVTDRSLTNVPAAPAVTVLAIDVSNALTSLCLWRDEHAEKVWRLQSDPRRTRDELALVLDDLLRSADVEAAVIDGAVMACVVPELAPVMSDVLTRVLGKPVLAVGPGVRTGVAVKTDDPREVGPDRIANAAAATARYGAPVVVVDCATALTFDVVDASGAYVGAIITPGLDVAADALARGTAGLPRIDLAAPRRAIGTSTEECLQSGLVLGYVGLVEGLVAALRQELGPAPVIATGESPWAQLLVDACPAIETYEPLLTLDGLRRIFVRALIEHSAAVAR